MVKGIGHAAFNVKDMERSIAFYENTMSYPFSEYEAMDLFTFPISFSVS